MVDLRPIFTLAFLRLIKIGSLSGFVSLVACAPATPFQNSTVSDAVKVEIRAGQLQARSWVLYTFDNGNTCQGRRVVAGSASSKNTDVFVESGKRHTYMLSLEDGGYFCRVAASFDAKAGNIYSVRVSSDLRRCYIATLNTTKTIEGTREPTSVRRTIEPAFVESGSWCSPHNPADVGKPIESAAMESDRSQLPKAPDGSRQGATLDDLKDLLPKVK